MLSMQNPMIRNGSGAKVCVFSAQQNIGWVAEECRIIIKVHAIVGTKSAVLPKKFLFVMRVVHKTL